MNSHRLRLIVLLVVTSLFAIAAFVLFVLGLWSDAATGVFGTALGILVPAVIDATRVERRRLTPGQKAIADDVD